MLFGVETRGFALVLFYFLFFFSVFLLSANAYDMLMQEVGVGVCFLRWGRSSRPQVPLFFSSFFPPPPFAKLCLMSMTMTALCACALRGETTGSFLRRALPMCCRHYCSTVKTTSVFDTRGEKKKKEMTSQSTFKKSRVGERCLACVCWF